MLDTLEPVVFLTATRRSSAWSNAEFCDAKATPDTDTIAA